MSPDNLFDPKLYREVRKPLSAASTLPGWCYTDPAFYAREVDQIFRGCWHFVGREDEIPSAATIWFLTESRGQSL